MLFFAQFIEASVILFSGLEAAEVSVYVFS
jgi:hypothetical protein